MVYLAQLPFSHSTSNWGMAPGALLANQRHFNPYPHLVSSALLTHVAFEENDFIISFSGCKIYSSQDVCNALFFNYFAKSIPEYRSIEDPELTRWLRHELDTFYCHPQIQNLILYSKLPLKCVYLQNLYHFI